MHNLKFLFGITILVLHVHLTKTCQPINENGIANDIGPFYGLDRYCVLPPVLGKRAMSSKTGQQLMAEQQAALQQQQQANPGAVPLSQLQQMQMLRGAASALNPTIMTVLEKSLGGPTHTSAFGGGIFAPSKHSVYEVDSIEELCNANDAGDVRLQVTFLEPDGSTKTKSVIVNTKSDSDVAVKIYCEVRRDCNKPVLVGKFPGSGLAKAQNMIKWKCIKT